MGYFQRFRHFLEPMFALRLVWALGFNFYVSKFLLEDWGVSHPVFWIGIICLSVYAVLWAAGVVKHVRRSRQTLGVYLLLFLVLAFYISHSHKNPGPIDEMFLFFAYLWVGVCLGLPTRWHHVTIDWSKLNDESRE